MLAELKNLLKSSDKDSVSYGLGIIRHSTELSYSEKLELLRRIPILERIQSYEDICFETGDRVLTLEDFPIKNAKRQLAYHKLMVISEFLNEGWIPDFKNRNQYKYFPWFQKQSNGSWMLRSSALVYGGGAGLGFGLYYKDEKIALFAGKTFLDIYLDYLPY